MRSSIHIIVLAGCCACLSYGQIPDASPATKELQLLLREAAKTNKVMRIEPGLSVGGVRIGMPMEDVEKVLGKPYETQGKVLHYQHLGLSIVPKRGGGVGAIMCGSWCSDEEDLLAKAFKGETREGIRTGSSTAEVESIYGKPEKTRPLDGWIEWAYPSRGVTFTFQNGRLRHMVIRAPASVKSN